MVFLPPILYLDQVMLCAPRRLYIKKAQAARFSDVIPGNDQVLIRCSCEGPKATIDDFQKNFLT